MCYRAIYALFCDHNSMCMPLWVVKNLQIFYISKSSLTKIWDTSKQVFQIKIHRSWSILNPEADYHLENHIYFTLPSQWSFLVETFPSIPLHFVQLWNYNAHNKTAKITTTSCRLILDSIFCRKMKLCTLSILLSCLLSTALMNV